MSKVLTAELLGILKEAERGLSDKSSSVEVPPSEDKSICEDSDAPCWHLQEASQFIAEDFAEVTGLDVGVLVRVLTEAMDCDSECGSKYRTKKGGFIRGGKGVAFQNCEKYAKECCSGVVDLAAFCAYLGRRANKL